MKITFADLNQKTQIMKKLFLVTVIAVLGLSNVNAQDIKFGAKAGLNFAFITGDNAKDLDPTTNFHFGVMSEIKLSDKFSLQPELIYSGQGADTNIASEGIIGLNYLNLPLIGKYFVTERLSLEAGPQIGLAISHKEEFDSGFDLFDTSGEFDPQSFDWGVNFGGGFKTNTGITLGIRYHLGLGDIYDEGSPKNRVWNFSIGFEL